MKKLVNGFQRVMPSLVLTMLLFVMKGFSQTPVAMRSFVVESKSYGDITLAMNDLNANTGITIFIEKSVNGGAYSVVGSFSSQPSQPNPTYIATGLTVSTPYCFRARARNSAGVYSEYSQEACATTNALPVPSGLVATETGPNSVRLNWTSYGGKDSGLKVAIERSTSAGGAFIQIGTADGEYGIYTDNGGLSPETQYCYRIRGIWGSAGNSGYSNVACATTRNVAPNTPQSLLATPVSNTQINLNWTDNSGNETGFEVERSSDGTVFTKIADVAANGTTYQSTGLSTLTKYWYRIRAKNAIGYSPYSNVAETTTFDVPPISPTDLTATTASSSQINLAWKDNSSNESVFDIERSTDGNSFSKVGEAIANSNTFQDTGLAPATKYWYRVRSRNAQGASDPTNVATATTRDVIPNAPSDLVASATDYFSVNLVWSDNSGNEKNFAIERSTDGSNFIYVDSVGKNTTTFSNKGLKDQTTYYFRIRALNAIGYSGYSNVAVVTTPKVPLPARPENLKVTAIDFDLVRLTWDAVSPNTKTVVVERSESPDENFTEISRVPYPGRLFDDREILDVTDHYYRIKAINDAGASPYSDIVKLSANAIITGAEPAADEDLAYVHGKILYVRLGQPRFGRLLLYDTRGVVIKNVKLSQNMEVDLKAIGSGLYVAVIDGNQKIIRRKVLVP